MKSRRDVQKIESVYYLLDAEPTFLKEPFRVIKIYSEKRLGRVYINLDELIDVAYQFRPKCIVLQFDIPKEKQNTILQSYKKEIAVNGLLTITETRNVPFNAIVNCHNYVGLWECSINENAIVKKFKPCDVLLKHSFLDTIILKDVDEEEEYSSKSWCGC